MKLENMTNSNLICLDVNANQKNDVLDLLIEELYKNKKINDKEEFKKAVLFRESLSPTGFENGIAIPHGKSKSVIDCAFAVARLVKPCDDWESISDENKVDLVFLLAIPEEGGEHMQLLSTLSQAIMEPSFLAGIRKAKTSSEVLKNMEIKNKGIKTEVASKTVLAITSCSTGIAHTYMAAKALEQAGEEMGINVIVEKQGANGIEDAHTEEQIRKADGIIFACDIAAKKTGRYDGLPYIKTKVAEPLKDAKKVIKTVLENPDGIFKGEQVNEEKNKNTSIFSEMMQAVMTGISYMIPVIVAAGLMMGIAKIVALGMGDINDFANFATSSNGFEVFLANLDKFGGMIFKFIYPVFAAYTAYSIADRPGLVPGFVSGAFAGGLHFIFWGVEGGIPSGFLGALVLGLVSGYLSRFLNNKIKLNENLKAVKPMLLVPGISVLIIFVLNMYIVDPVFGGLNQMLADWIASFGTTNTLLLTSVIAACTAFDLGGPVNKAAGAIAIGLATDLIFPLTGRVLSIVIPPIGLGVATVIDKFVVRKRVFDENERVLGSSSIILGLIAVSEGAIPFMLKNPLITIPINICGAILGSCTAVLLGAVQWNPLPAVWGWPLVENLPAYIIGLIVGVLFIALANIFVRYAQQNRKLKG